jgi:hypothetical protein
MEVVSSPLGLSVVEVVVVEAGVLSNELGMNLRVMGCSVTRQPCQEAGLTSGIVTDDVELVGELLIESVLVV